VLAEGVGAADGAEEEAADADLEDEAEDAEDASAACAADAREEWADARASFVDTGAAVAARGVQETAELVASEDASAACAADAGSVVVTGAESGRNGERHPAELFGDAFAAPPKLFAGALLGDPMDEGAGAAERPEVADEAGSQNKVNGAGVAAREGEESAAELVAGAVAALADSAAESAASSSPSSGSMGGSGSPGAVSGVASFERWILRAKRL
jgi:hypothetical protein